MRLDSVPALKNPIFLTRAFRKLKEPFMQSINSNGHEQRRAR